MGTQRRRSARRLPVFWFWPIAVSPFVGSFLGVLIRRLPLGQDVVSDRSRCEACHRTLGPGDLVPILSFLALRGRCRGCRAPIARFHLWIELAAMALACVVVANGGGEARIWAGCGLGWTLLALSWIDLRHGWLPDLLTLPLIVAGLTCTAWLDPEGMPQGLLEPSAGAAVGYTMFRLVAFGYRALRGRDGLGQGDAKLIAASGAWLGLAGLGPVLLLSASLGLVVALASHIGGRRSLPLGDVAIPFGPFIGLSTFALYLLSG